MHFRDLIVLVLLVFSANFTREASATTYTCTKVQDKATLAYDGSDSVTDNHSSGKCSWSIGSATCTGCRQVRWQEFQELVGGLSRNSGYNNARGRLRDYFPVLAVAARQNLDVNIDDVGFDDFNCKSAGGSNIRDYLDYRSAGYSNVKIACVIYEFSSYHDDIRVGDTIIQPTSNLLIISVKRDWGGGEVTSYVRVPR